MARSWRDFFGVRRPDVALLQRHSLSPPPKSNQLAQFSFARSSDEADDFKWLAQLHDCNCFRVGDRKSPIQPIQSDRRYAINMMDNAAVLLTG